MLDVPFRIGARRLFPATALVVAAWAGACGGTGDGSVFVDPSAHLDGGDGIDAAMGNPDDSGFILFGDASSGDSGSLAKTLVFDPPTQQLVLDGTNAKTATFRLRATFPDGTTQYVTAQSLQFDRPDLASVTAGTSIALTAPGTYAGKGHLHGVYGGIEAVAELDVVVQQKDLGSVSAPIAALLDGTGAAANDPSLSSLLYPYDKTVFPLGLTSPLVMWTMPNGGTGANATDVYRLRLEEANYTYDAYSVVPARAQLRIPQSIWDRVSASNSGDSVKVQLSRWDSASQKAYTSAAISFTIAPASLRGAIYYWTASQDAMGVRAGHITRIRPGTGAMPQPLNQGRCMGCHAVSADGTTLVAAIDDPASAPAVPPYVLGWQSPNYTRPWASFNVADPAAPQIKLSTQYGADIALTPNGAYAVFGAPTAVAGSRILSMSDTKTGALITTSGLDDVTGLGAGDNLSMPAFSPDGSKLAVVQGPAGDNVLPVPNAIAYLDFDMNTQHFAPALHSIVLANDAAFVTTGRGLGYPSFTPDSKSIAFHAGTQSTGCQRTETIGGQSVACADPNHDDGNLFFAQVGGGSPIRLANINDPPNPSDRNSAVEPTFNPQARGGYSWVVFTSMRDWGNKLTGDTVNGKRRLWVAAIDAVTGAVDPSHPAFYLEGQEDTPNMRGFWALATCTATPKPGVDAGTSGGACGAGFECCSGFCDKGVCVDVSTLACAAAGGSCSTAGDCCNGGTAVDCNAGICTVVTPK